MVPVRSGTKIYYNVEATDEETMKFPFFDQIGNEMMRRHHPGIGTSLMHTDDQRFCATYGMTASICATLWHMVKPETTMPKGAHPVHLLWCLVFLNIYATEAVLCTMAGGVDEKTFRKSSWMFVDELSYLKDSVVTECSAFSSPTMVTQSHSHLSHCHLP